MDIGLLLVSAMEVFKSPWWCIGEPFAETSDQRCCMVRGDASRAAAASRPPSVAPIPIAALSMDLEAINRVKL
jgi:hypothetical protein